MKRQALTAVVIGLVAALVAGYGSSVGAQPVAGIALPSPRGTVQLYPGCNNIALSFPDGTSSETVVQAVTPPGVVQTMWRHNAALNNFEGFSPAAPQASDLLTVNLWDAVWLCVAGASALGPSAPPPAPTATALPPAAPTAAATPPPPPSPTATALPTQPPSPGPAASFGDGTFIVGVDIAPGTYRAPNTSAGCYWERLSGFGGEFGDIIANGFTDDPEVVTIAATDAGFSSDDCGLWTVDLSPITSSLTSPFGEGKFIVGVDVAPGTWRSSATGAGCYWARLSGFSGTFSDIIANNFSDSIEVITVGPGDIGFESSGCGTWTKIS